MINPRQNGAAIEAELENVAILPLLSGEGNQRLLFEWVRKQDGYRLVDPDRPLEAVEFDCCILDGESLEQHAELLRERKREAEPVLLPCLLLLPEADLSVIEIDQGEIADSVVFETVDEVVSMPIKKAELKWRTEALLRLRAQSLRLNSKRRELRLFKLAAESAGHAIYITDTDGTIKYVNPAFERITGYSEAEAIGKSPEIFSSGDLPDSYYERLWETLTSGEVWEEDILNERKDGERYHASQTIAPVKSDSGELERFVAIQSDITERVNVTKRLEMIRDIVERLEDPIMLQDKEGQFILVNDALTTYAEMPREELLGETETAFMDEESATFIEERKQEVIETEQPVRYTISPTFPAEDNEVFSTRRYPYYDKDGSVAGTLAICRVVTDVKSREQQLEVIDRVLRHNLRNDMTTIGMFAEKLQAAVEGELVEDTNRILETSRKVNRMVQKQRDITKFLTESSRSQTVDLSQLARTLADRKRDQYPTAEIALTIPETCPVTTTVAIEQAVAELIENSIVHAESDSPVVEIQVTDDTDGPSITVADNGPGIPEMDRQVLTGNNESEQLYHGSGLGLWLIHLIVEEAGGSITVEETKPSGTAVTITLQR